MEGTQVQPQVWEDSMCQGGIKPMSHNHWAHVPRAHAPQQEKPPPWEAHAPQWRVASAHHNWRKPMCMMKTQHRQKKKKKKPKEMYYCP